MGSSTANAGQGLPGISGAYSPYLTQAYNQFLNPQLGQAGGIGQGTPSQQAAYSAIASPTTQGMAPPGANLSPTPFGQLTTQQGGGIAAGSPLAPPPTYGQTGGVSDWASIPDFYRRQKLQEQRIQPMAYSSHGF